MHLKYNSTKYNKFIILSMTFAIGVIIYYYLTLFAGWDFLLFHTLVEYLTISGYLMILTLTLILWKDLKNYPFIAITGLSMIPIIFLDLMHILSFTGMPYFVLYNGNLTLTFWIAARIIQSCSLLIGIILSIKSIRIKLYIPLIVFTLIPFIIIYMILVHGNMLELINLQGGLTDLKVGLEFLIAIIILISISFFHIIKNDYSDSIFFRLFIIFFLISELALTTYSQLYDFHLIIGHYFKLLSTMFLISFLFKTSLSIPNMSLFNKLKISESKLKKIAYIDKLTGIFNRAKFDMDYISEKDNMQKSIILGDINGLKKINDKYGVVLGDNVLIDVSQVLRTHINSNDILYRINGAEFAIITDILSDQELHNYIVKMTEKVNSVSIDDENISFTMGYATRDSEALTNRELYSKAETHLIRNKSFESNSKIAEGLTLLMNALFARSLETQEHSTRVTLLLTEFGKKIGLKTPEIKLLEQIGNLHDIGKIGVSDDILCKDGPLTPSEHKAIKSHSEIGYRILSSINSLNGVDEVILHHHERWDGTGYPYKLSGNAIPFYSRMLSICDTVDAMYSGRPYREAVSSTEINNELEFQAGKQFDPDLVIKFTKHFDELLIKAFK